MPITLDAIRVGPDHYKAWVNPHWWTEEMWQACYVPGWPIAEDVPWSEHAAEAPDADMRNRDEDPRVHFTGPRHWPHTEPLRRLREIVAEQQRRKRPRAQESGK